MGIHLDLVEDEAIRHRLSERLVEHANRAHGVTYAVDDERYVRLIDAPQLAGLDQRDGDARPRRDMRQSAAAVGVRRYVVEHQVRRVERLRESSRDERNVGMPIEGVRRRKGHQALD
jgi:hypothetical protein